MTSIKKLEIFGFKSFYNKKQLNFPPGLSIVMGPNGSGKSNLIEAICFVLGKASRKDLRAEKLGDLVYHGGKKLPPSKFAKVTMILDNSKNEFKSIEESELKISRMVDKEGRSVYRVNGKRQPREYIKSLLHRVNIDPDGYNIVLQGEIAKFIDLSPDERRKIIEELSGISIYEEKKHKAILELNKVKKKISDASIILTEKTKYMEQLQKEKDQAEKFKSIKDLLNFKKASKLFAEKTEIESSKKGYQKQLDDKEQEISGIINTQQEIKKAIDKKEKELEELNKKLEHSGEVEQVELTKEIEAIKNRTNELKLLIESEKKEIKRIDERKSQIETDININKENTQKSKTSISEYNERIKELQKKLDEKEEKFIKLSNVDKERANLLAKLNSLDNDTINIKGQLTELEKKAEEQDYADQLKEKLGKLQDILSEKLSENSKLAKMSSELKQEREKIFKEIHQIEGKKEVLLRLLNKGVQSIIAAKDKFPGVHGLVSELGKTNNEFSLPLKVAAGSRADSIVVDDENVAKDCIHYLRENKLGIATFLPLNKIKSRSSGKNAPEVEGVVDYAINLIDFDPMYKKIFEYVLGDTLIVKNIGSAKKVGIGKNRMVTLEGDLIEQSGAMSGGFRKKKGVGFDQAPLDEKLKNLKKKAKTLTAEIDNSEQDYQNSSERCNKLRSEIYTIESQLEKIDKVDLKDIDTIKQRLSEKRKEQEKIKENLEKLPKQVETKVLEKLDKDVKDLRENLQELEAKKRGIDFELEISGRDLERGNKLLSGLEKEKIGFENKIKENKKELEKITEKLKHAQEEEKKFYGKLREQYNQRNKTTDEIKKLELKKAKLDNEISKLRDHANDYKLKIAELTARIEAKESALKEYEGVEVKEVNEKPEQLEKQINELELQITSFGSVNMRALDVFQEVKKEHDNLKERCDHLENERLEVLKVIDEIELKKRDVFMDAYTHVSKNFSRIFAHLSPGGEAKLILENEDNPFEGGLDIRARPGGKKVASLRAMSGGEKTLTALTFVFAVQEYDPSPFYIMDEVDAALDKENTEKLSILLNQYSKRSQFIVISHNDTMISEADNLYGVHMNKLGESQVVNLRLPQK